MPYLYEVRYVSWPRDQLRKFEYPETVTQLEETGRGIVWRSSTGKTEVLIPWHNIIDITYMEMKELRQREVEREAAFQKSKELHEKASAL